MSEIAAIKNPFPGPQPYRAADRDRFFGRDLLVKKLANQLLARSATTLFGPSGAGKSSLVQAGVIPKLQETHDFQVVRVDGWPSEERPLSWLVRAIHAELELGPPSPDTQGLEALDEAMALAERRSEQPILIYLDQLEQLLFPERPEGDAEELIAGVDRLARAPLQGLQMVLSLREDYLGRFRDRARDRKELLAHGFRLGPLTVIEMVKAVCRAAQTGTPPQNWDETQLLGLMREVRVPGQAASNEAEVQAAYAQIVCRALFQQRHNGEAVDGDIQAEAILRRYLDTTVADLGPLSLDARRLLEDHLVTADGSRTLRTEKELLRLLPQEKLGPILKALEGAAILHAEAHQGSRYFEIGHDWLARKVFEERQLREREEEQRRREREQAEALVVQRAQLRKYATIAFVSVAIAAGAAGMGVFARTQQAKAERAGQAAERARKKAETAEEVAKKKAIEASDARLLAGFRELKNAGQLGWGTKLLAEVQEPNETRGWISLASDALGSNALEVTLRGHEKALRGAVWSPDGKRVLTASLDGTARVWNGDGAGMPVVLAGHDKPLTIAAWSADGTRVLTGSEDGTVRIWKTDGTDKPIVVDHHAGPIVSAALDASGKRLLVATGNDAFVGDDNGKGFVRLTGHTAPITSAAFFSDGQRIVTTSADGTARVWNVETPTRSIVLRGHRDEVLFAAPSLDGTKLVTTSRDTTARVWDAAGKGAPVVLAGHERSVVHAAWSAEGSRIATASADGTARVWAADGKNESVVLSGHTAAVEFVSWRPDGRYVATASRDQSARIWPAEGGEAFVLMGHEAPVTSVVWNAEGSRLLTAAAEDNGRSLDPTARVWRPERLESLTRERHGFFHSAFLGGAGEFVVAAYDDLSVRLFRLDGTGQTQTWKDHAAWITSAMASPDGSKIVSTSVDKTARVVRRDGTGEAVVLSGAEAVLRWAAWSPDGEHIVTVSDDKRARIHRADGTGDVVNLSGHTDAVVFAAWSPNGKQIVTTSLDHTARVWNADARGESLVLQGHEAPVVYAAWSADGSRIVTASEDGYAQVFDAERGDVRTNLGHDRPVVSVAFSPDGKTIATSTRKGGLYLWSADGKREPVIVETSSPIIALAFVDEGKRILTVGADNTTRVFTVGIDALKQGLAKTNKDCLPADKRVIYLGESGDKADDRYIVCERAFGRLEPKQERQTP